MRKTPAGLIFLFLFRPADAVMFSAGPELWQHNSTFLNSLVLGAEDSVAAGFGTFDYRVSLPVFVRRSGDVFFPGQELADSREIDSPFQILREKSSAPLILPELSLSRDGLKTGISPFFPDRVSGSHLLWNSPLRDREVPAADSHFLLAFPGGGLHSSSLRHPSFTLAHYSWQPAPESPVYFLSGLEITPLLWHEFLEDTVTSSAGGGLDIRTGGYRTENFSLGFSLFGDYLHHRSVGTTDAWQTGIGPVVRFFRWQWEGGVLGQSGNHFRGPVLSSVYPQLIRETQTGSTAFLPGGWTGLELLNERAPGFRGRAYYFASDRPVTSWLAEIVFRSDDTLVSFGYLKEDVSTYLEFNRHHQPDAFVSFEVEIRLLRNLLIFRWQTFQAYDGSPFLFSRLGVTAAW